MTKKELELLKYLLRDYMVVAQEDDGPASRWYLSPERARLVRRVKRWIQKEEEKKWQKNKLNT